MEYKRCCKCGHTVLLVISCVVKSAELKACNNPFVMLLNLVGTTRIKGDLKNTGFEDQLLGYSHSHCSFDSMIMYTSKNTLWLYYDIGLHIPCIVKHNPVCWKTKWWFSQVLSCDTWWSISRVKYFVIRSVMNRLSAKFSACLTMNESLMIHEVKGLLPSMTTW